jgi:hypothetical protein
MRRVWTMVLLLGLGLGLAGCSKCSIPTWGSQACHQDGASG